MAKETSDEFSSAEIPKLYPVLLEEKEAMSIRGEGHIRHAAKPKLRHRSRRKGSQTPKRKNAHEYKPAHGHSFFLKIFRTAPSIKDAVGFSVKGVLMALFSPRS
jgi:hypothetical protein